MADEIRKLVSKCSWKAKLMLRARRCHSDAHMMGLFKTKVLNYIEYRTAAISHAARSALRPLGAVLSDFLKQINMTELDALRNFNLAPLQVRKGHRDARYDSQKPGPEGNPAAKGDIESGCQCLASTRINGRY